MSAQQCAALEIVIGPVNRGSQLSAVHPGASTAGAQAALEKRPEGSLGFGAAGTGRECPGVLPLGTAEPWQAQECC